MLFWDLTISILDREKKAKQKSKKKEHALWVYPLAVITPHCVSCTPFDYDLFIFVKLSNIDMHKPDNISMWGTFCFHSNNCYLKQMLFSIFSCKKKKK